MFSVLKHFQISLVFFFSPLFNHIKKILGKVYTKIC